MNRIKFIAIHLIPLNSIEVVENDTQSNLLTLYDFDVLLKSDAAIYANDGQTAICNDVIQFQIKLCWLSLILIYTKES